VNVLNHFSGVEHDFSLGNTKSLLCPNDIQKTFSSLDFASVLQGEFQLNFR
jgi:hypothetical protein